MKKYNPITLNIITDQPSYETEQCKWWLCELSENERFAVYLTVTKTDGKMDYLIIDNKTREILYITQILEEALMHLTMCEKAEELEKEE